MYRSCGTRLRSQCVPIYGIGTCVPVSGSSPSGPACLFRLSGAAFLIRCASVHVHGAHLSAPRETRSASTASIKYRRSPSVPATTAVGNNNRRVNDSGEHEKVEDQRGTHTLSKILYLSLNDHLQRSKL